MCLSPIVLGASKYTLVTSGWRGDILKKGPRMVRVSISGAVTAIWKAGSCEIAMTNFGNEHNSFMAFVVNQTLLYAR